MKTELRKGDYVLATKYTDGDPCDHHCVGFFREMLGNMFLVEDIDGKLFRLNGFRRCERISKKAGDALVRSFPYISDRAGKSIWFWRRNLKKLNEFIDALSAHTRGEG